MNRAQKYFYIFQRGLILKKSLIQNMGKRIYM